jgi:hypothetical protein
VHLLEGRFDVVDADRLADEVLQREAALPRPKTSISGSVMVMSGVGTPTSTTRPARSRA